MLMLGTAAAIALLDSSPVKALPPFAACEVVAAQRRKLPPRLGSHPLTEEPPAHKILTVGPAFTSCPVKTYKLRTTEPRSSSDIRP